MVKELEGCGANVVSREREKNVGLGKTNLYMLEIVFCFTSIGFLLVYSLRVEYRRERNRLSSLFNLF